MEKESLILQPEMIPPPIPAKTLKIKPSHLRLVDTSEKISEEAPNGQDKAFTTRYLVQATLPHRNPKDNPPFWYRVNGNYTLTIQPGTRTDPKTGKPESLGYPFGSLPRLILFWLTTEAVRRGNRRLMLGNNLSEFMRGIGLNPDNGSTGAKRSDKRRLVEQMERLFRAKLSFDYNAPGVKSWLDMQVAPKASLWWDIKNPEQLNLYESWIELGEDFFTRSPIRLFLLTFGRCKRLKILPSPSICMPGASTKHFLSAKKPNRSAFHGGSFKRNSARTTATQKISNEKLSMRFAKSPFFILALISTR